MEEKRTIGIMTYTKRLHIEENGISLRLKKKIREAVDSENPLKAIKRLKIEITGISLIRKRAVKKWDISTLNMIKEKAMEEAKKYYKLNKTL